MDKKLLWRMSAVVTFAVMLVTNGLAASTTLLGGWTTADVSAAYPSLFTPAGYTFAIWGVIYTLGIAYFAYQFGLVGKVAKDKQQAIDDITPYVAALSLVNIAWIISWQHNIIWLALLFIVTMLALLIRINEHLRTLKYTATEFALLRAPFSVYYGWLTVATVANVSVWLVSINWGGWGVSDSSWLVTILWVAAAIGATATLRNKDWPYGLVFIWAYIGILMNSEQLEVAVVANLALLITVLAGVAGYVYADLVKEKRWWPLIKR